MESDKSTPRKPPSLVLPSIECPLICEQGPSKPSSPTIPMNCDLIPQDLMTRIQMFSSQFDHARLSPNYATSDLGSSARSSFSTSSWIAYRDRSIDFDENGKELVSPFECDTACSVSPSFSLSPNSFDHFSFDARSVASLCNSTNNLNNFLTVAPLEPRERSRSESDMSPLLNISALSRSTDSVPFYCKSYPSTAPKPNQENKRSSSTPPPTTSARIDVDSQFPATSQDDKDLLNTWTRNQLIALQTANLYDQAVSNMLSASAKLDGFLPSSSSSLNLEVPQNPMKLFVPPSPSSSTGTLVDDGTANSKEDLTTGGSCSSQRSQQNQFVCSLCGQAFSVHDRLAKHIASRHRQRSCTLDDASKIHKCGLCSKSFSRSDMLTRHMRLHTGAKPYSCPTCSQVFSRSDHLSTHLRTHTGEKPYGCPLCAYSASRRDMISRHMRTHSMTESSTTIDLAAPIGDLSIRSASTSPLPQKVPPPVIVGIGSGELSAFKPIKSSSSNNHLSVSAPFQSLSLSTPNSPIFSRSSSTTSSTQYDYASLDKNNGLFLK